MTKKQQGASAPSGFYTDNLGIVWKWKCPYVYPDDIKPTPPVVELDERILVPYGSVASEWMEWVLGFMFASGLFGWLGLPVYLVLGTVCYVYYNVINFFGIIYYMQVQWFGIPVENTLEDDLSVYTLGNYIDYP